MKRHLFAAGRLGPDKADISPVVPNGTPYTGTDEGPATCPDGFHEGPLLEEATFAKFGGMWSNMGNCAACGSTIHRSHLRENVA